MGAPTRCPIRELAGRDTLEGTAPPPIEYFPVWTAMPGLQEPHSSNLGENPKISLALLGLT